MVGRVNVEVIVVYRLVGCHASNWISILKPHQLSVIIKRNSKAVRIMTVVDSRRFEEGKDGDVKREHGLGGVGKKVYVLRCEDDVIEVVTCPLELSGWTLGVVKIRDRALFDNVEKLPMFRI